MIAFKPPASGLVVALILLAVPALSDGSERSDWSRLPAAARRVAIWSSRDVPAYPEDADSMLQVQRWPKTRVFDGELYGLEFSAGKADMVRLNVADLSDIEPGWNYGAHYVRILDDETKSPSRGPWYNWRSDSTLSDRSYITSSFSGMWGYNAKGALVQYTFARRDAKTGDWARAAHYFAASDGALIALLYDGKSYWKGAETSSEGLFRKLAAYYRWKRYG